VVKKTKKTSPTKSSTNNHKKLSAADIKYFKNLLLEKRKEILGDVDSLENDSLKQSRGDAAGDLSSMPIHMADIGSDNYEQEFTLGLLDSERKILTEIYDALERIADKTYGICQGTDKLIPRARLEAKPWCKYCVEYAQLIEKGMVKLHDNAEDDNPREDEDDSEDRDE